MRILVSGSTGLVGSALVPALIAGGHEVAQLVRSRSKSPSKELVQWDPENRLIDEGSLSGFDAVAHLAGENIAGGRWNEARKKRIRESRSLGTRFLAEKLAQITPGALKKSFFTNSGTEANETAVLLAKRFTGKNEIVALKHAYHGRSWLAASLTAIAAYRVDPQPVPGISFAENPYCYRCPYGQNPDGCGLECANDLERVIQTQTTGQPATFIAETIQGVGGIRSEEHTSELQSH